jgi:hypothetical protein
MLLQFAWTLSRWEIDKVNYFSTKTFLAQPIKLLRWRMSRCKKTELSSKGSSEEQGDQIGRIFASLGHGYQLRAFL